MIDNDAREHDSYLPTVDVLIISYNTASMTADCVASMLADRAVSVSTIIVLDNASSDGSADLLATRFGNRLRIIRSSENVGFAAGSNVAAVHASSEFLLLLNPDTLIRDDAIAKLLLFARTTPAAGIWGGRTVFADGSLNPASCWRRLSLWILLCQALGLSSIFRGSRVFNMEAYGGWRRETVRQVDIVSGCFLLIRREFWEQLGGFDPQFFMYGEDADLCLRAAALGARPVVTPEATIVHYGGASEKVRGDKLVRLLSAKALLVRRHFHPLLRPVGILLLAMWPFTRAVAWSVLSRLRPAPEAIAAREAWCMAWRRRREWLGGRSAPEPRVGVP